MIVYVLSIEIDYGDSVDDVKLGEFESVEEAQAAALEDIAAIYAGPVEMVWEKRGGLLYAKPVWMFEYRIAAYDVHVYARSIVEPGSYRKARGVVGGVLSCW